MKPLIGDDCYDLPMDLEIVQSAVQTIHVEHAGPDDLHLDAFRLNFGDDSVQGFWCSKGVSGQSIVLTGTTSRLTQCALMKSLTRTYWMRMMKTGEGTSVN